MHFWICISSCIFLMCPFKALQKNPFCCKRHGVPYRRACTSIHIKFKLSFYIDRIATKWNSILKCFKWCCTHFRCIIILWVTEINKKIKVIFIKSNLVLKLWRELQDYICEKYRWKKDKYDELNWRAVGDALKTYSLYKRNRIIQIL